MHQGGGLLGDGGGEVGVTMADGAGGDAGAEVEILVSFVIPDFGALATCYGERESAVGLEDVVLGFFVSGHERLGRW